MDIEELVKLAKERNTEAFGQLYDEFADKLYRFILIKVSSKTVAEDLLQEVFLKTWQGLEKLKLDDLNFNAWIYKVTLNTVNDFYRKHYRQPQTVELDEGLPIISEISPEAELSLNMDINQIKQALIKLPSQYQQILELRFIQDFTLEETAEILEKNNLSVRVLQHRALKQLKTLLT